MPIALTFSHSYHIYCVYPLNQFPALDPLHGAFGAAQNQGIGDRILGIPMRPSCRMFHINDVRSLRIAEERIDQVRVIIDFSIEYMILVASFSRNSTLW
jgi:hypothetical protein